MTSVEYGRIKMGLEIRCQQDKEEIQNVQNAVVVGLARSKTQENKSTNMDMRDAHAHTQYRLSGAFSDAGSVIKAQPRWTATATRTEQQSGKGTGTWWWVGCVHRTFRKRMGRVTAERRLARKRAQVRERALVPLQVQRQISGRRASHGQHGRSGVSEASSWTGIDHGARLRVL